MGRIRVLVVDDHELVRKHVCAFLVSQPDLEIVCEASDGFEAIQHAEQHQPDVVLLDISLPRLNGLQAAASIRKVAPKAQILFFSQHDNPYFVRQAFAIGGLGYVTKDNGVQDLVAAIKAVHAGQSFVSNNLRSALNPQKLSASAMNGRDS